jgi:hypothetical protein
MASSLRLGLRKPGRSQAEVLFQTSMTRWSSKRSKYDSAVIKFQNNTQSPTPSRRHTDRAGVPSAAAEFAARWQVGWHCAKPDLPA